jgi:hypothetical protein
MNTQPAFDTFRVIDNIPGTTNWTITIENSDSAPITVSVVVTCVNAS